MLVVPAELLRLTFAGIRGTLLQIACVLVFSCRPNAVVSNSVIIRLRYLKKILNEMVADAMEAVDRCTGTLQRNNS
ncbi:hypothetical protein GE09DRAFT_637142 [Coniochaeta sp. 2T2.1]|nr:hypothetical protein GE09DRAFT_637142 [Coniochaeta sp. 2T2.1]